MKVTSPALSSISKYFRSQDLFVAKNEVLYRCNKYGWMMTEAARTSETSVDNYFTRQYIPEDNFEQQFKYVHIITAT
jgi:hypothetical protein